MRRVMVLTQRVTASRQFSVTMILGFLGET